MAYIPEEEENNQESGMDVLAEGQQAPQQQVQQPQGDQQLISGQSSTIGADAPQQAPQEQAQGRKPKGSGMFTDIRKYIKAGQPGIQRMGQAVSGGVQKQTTGLGQQLAKKQQQFGQQVSGQQQRLGQSQQFAQDATQRAATQQNIPHLQQQQEARRKSIEALGPLKEGGYQADIDPLTGAPKQLSQLQTQSGQLGQSSADASRKARDLMWQSIGGGGSSANFQKDLQGRLQSWNQRMGDTMDQYRAGELDMDSVREKSIGDPFHKAALQKIAALEASKQMQELDPDIQKFQEQTKKLEDFKTLQSKFEESQTLGTELADLTQKIETAPESLTPEEIQRFHNLTSGETRFDQIGMLDTGAATARARALENLVKGAEMPTGRGELLRETLGRGREYTRGQRGLDELLLSSRPDVQQQMLDTATEATTGFKSDVTEARKRALEDMYGLRKGTFDLVGQEGSALQGVVGEEGELTDLRSQLDQAIAAEQERLGTRREDLLGKFGKKQFLDAQDFTDLGISEQDQGVLQALATARGGSLNLADYLNVFDPTSVTRQGVAAPEQLAQQRALAALSGEQQFGDQVKPTLDFNMAGAIADMAKETPGINYSPEAGITGTKEALDAFSNKLMSINPFLAAPLMSISGPTAKAMDAVGEVTGQDYAGALGDTTQAFKDVEDLAIAPLKFAVDPFNMDQTKGILSSAGKVVWSPAQIASKLAPRVTGNRVMDALFTGGLTELGTVANKAESVYQSTLGKLFCFAKGAMIHLADGTKKAVEAISIGDVLLEGGEVFGTGQVRCPDIYEYRGYKVSGSHAVLENGEWIRVQDTNSAKKLDNTVEIVYPITCENHLLITDDFVSADFQETEDGIGYNDEARLEHLNKQTRLNEYLSQQYENTKKAS